jgi:hypothetical protein
MNLKKKGGHRQEKKADYLAAFPWRGSAMELIAENWDCLISSCDFVKQMLIS